ncbi:hypothetical protein ACWIG5_24015 [Streptomyces lydicus]
MQVDRLRVLSADFAALYTPLTELAPQQGTEVLDQIGPKIFTVHELIARALLRLSNLDNSQYTDVPGSRASLGKLSSVVLTASHAATDLATAIANNPLEAAGLPGPDDVALRAARHGEAAPLLTTNLSNAARALSLCAAYCKHTATEIATALKSHPHLAPLPQLTAAEYTALSRVAQGAARRYRRMNGHVSVLASDGKHIDARLFEALVKHRLIQMDTRTSPAAAQDVTITAAGHLALDTQKPVRASAAPPAKSPKPETGGKRR